MVSAENPGISFGEVGKQLGARWAEADEKTKKARGGRARPPLRCGASVRRGVPGPLAARPLAAKASRCVACRALPGARVG